MKGIKIALILCLVTLMVCNKDGVKDHLRKFKEDISSRISDFHIIDSTKEFFAGLKNKFDEATLNAKEKLYDSLHQVNSASDRLLEQLEVWRNDAVASAKRQYTKIDESLLLSQKLDDIQKTYDENSASIKKYLNEKIVQLKRLFKDEEIKAEEEIKKEEEIEKEIEEIKKEEEKALLELF